MNQQKKKGAPVDVVEDKLLPTSVRNSKKAELSQYFQDALQKMKFYDQAKDGKEDKDIPADVNQIMIKYFNQIRSACEVPNPVFS